MWFIGVEVVEQETSAPPPKKNSGSAPDTTYQKILADLKISHRGGPFNKQDFLKEVNILDETIIDFCPLVTKFEKQYGKKFLSTPTTNSN